MSPVIHLTSSWPDVDTLGFMKRILLFLVICAPIQTQAASYEATLTHNRHLIKTQQETDNAVRWTNLYGYNDKVAYQFIRRCGWLRITPGGFDWCNQSTGHRALIGLSYQQGSAKTLRLLKRYRKLG